MKYLSDKAIDEMKAYSIPPTTAEGLIRYIEKGVPCGHFLDAVIRNNLYGAVSHADLRNRAALAGIVQWLTNHAPCGCWGHDAAPANWRNVLASDKGEER